MRWTASISLHRPLVEASRWPSMTTLTVTYRWSAESSLVARAVQGCAPRGEFIFWARTSGPVSSTRWTFWTLPGSGEGSRACGSQSSGNSLLLTCPDTSHSPSPRPSFSSEPLSSLGITFSGPYFSSSSPKPRDPGCNRKPVGRRWPAGQLRSAHMAFSESGDFTIKIELASTPKKKKQKIRNHWLMFPRCGDRLPLLVRRHACSCPCPPVPCPANAHSQTPCSIRVCKTCLGFRPPSASPIPGWSHLTRSL